MKYQKDNISNDKNYFYNIEESNKNIYYWSNPTLFELMNPTNVAMIIFQLKTMGKTLNLNFKKKSWEKLLKRQNQKKNEFWKKWKNRSNGIWAEKFSS